jgi:hypothetical protein
MSRSGGRTRLALRLSCGFFCLLLAAGCASSGIVRSDGNTQWAGLGLALRLPPGGWRIEPQGENAVLFTPQGRPGNLLIERVKTWPNEPEWLALKKLLSSFDMKKEISLRAERLPDGESALRAEYDIQVAGGRTRLAAYLVPRAGFIYEIVEWNVGRDKLAELFLAALAPEAKPGPVPRTP